MSEEVTAALVGAGVGGVIGVIGAWLVANKTNSIAERLAKENQKTTERLALENQKQQEQATIDSLVLRMVELSIQFPTLEKDDFVCKYPDVPGGATAKARYESYCVFVFNLLMRIWKHNDRAAAKVVEYIGAEEIVRCHYRWWRHDKDNLNYDKDFRQFIQDLIDELTKKGHIK